MPKTRWAWRVVRALAVGGALALVAAATLLANVGQPWMKKHVRGLVSKATGLDIDYRTLTLRFPREVILHGLIVRSPAQVRAHAPVLLSAGTLRATVSWVEAASGPSLQALSAEAVHLAVVADERGRTSLDFVGSAADEPASPLSRQLEELLAKLPVERVRLSEVKVEYVRIERARLIERDVLDHVALEATLGRRGPDGAKLQARFGAAAGQLVLHRTLHDGTQHRADLAGSLRIEASGRAAQVALDVQLTRQSFSPDVPPRLHLELAASAAFDPDHARSSVQISKLVIGQGVMTAQALLELPDAGPPVVKTTQAELDVPRLVALLPAWLVPLRVERGHLSFRTPELPLSAAALPSSVEVEGELAGLHVQLAQGTVSLGDVAVELHGQPQNTGMHVEGKVQLSRAALESTAATLAAEGLKLAFAVAWDADLALSGHADVHFQALRTGQPEALDVREGALAFEAKSFAVARRAPLAVRGELRIEGSCAALERPGAVRLRADTVGVSARLRRSEDERLDGQLRVSAARLHAANRGGVLLEGVPLRWELALHDAAPDLQRPGRSLGRARSTLVLGGLRAALEVDAQGAALDYRVTASLARLGELRALAARARESSLGEDLGLELSSKGRLAGLGTRTAELAQESELRVSRLALARHGVEGATLHVLSRGGAEHHVGDATLQARGLAVHGVSLGDAALAVKATFDAPNSSLDVRMHVTQPARAALRAKLVLGADDVLQYEAEGDTSDLAPLSPLMLAADLGTLELSTLRLAFRSEGRLSGLLASDAAPAGLLHRLGGRARSHLTVHQLRWADGDLMVQIPEARLQTVFAREGDVRTVETELDVPTATARSGPTHIALEDLHDRSVASLHGDLRSGSLQVAQDMTVRSIEQDLVPGFPIGALSWKVRGSRGTDGVLKVSELQLENRDGGSSLKASGGIDMSGDRERLSLRAHLEQDLRPVAAQRALDARGRLGLDVSLASPDLRVFHTTAVLRLHDAHLAFESPAVALEGIDGEIPVILDFTLSRRGPRLLRGVPINPYAALRYADQHPMLAARSFVSIRRVTTPFGVLAPFAANLDVHQNIVSLSQIELGVRDGTVTGSSVLDWDGENSRLEVNLRASEVRSSHGEPFDGNAALVVDFAEHSVRGRADILRIGRRHLLDILDIQDPSHTDPAIQRIRTGLRFGYPERVRISFKHGFVNAGVSLGGFARFMRIDEVKGIPVGPLMERAMSRMRVAEAP